MHVHILGICGTFMGSLAVLAKELGYKVTGSDAGVYPPMSTQLEAQGIELMQGYSAEHLQPAPDLVIVGNAMSRGNPAVEYVLNENLPYISGPQWLAEHVLQGKHVLAMSGTHGKTTTSSMLAWLLNDCGIDCGYLIGGVPKNFDVSARLGSAPYFVIEADEYDSAFFDKRSKFVHYRPRTLVINNLEFDHADIFDSLADIQKQFHHVIRTVPEKGQVIYPAGIGAIDEVLTKGCWANNIAVDYVENVQARFYAKLLSEDGSAFAVYENTLDEKNTLLGEVHWSLLGLHNVQNGLSALISALQVGVEPQQAIIALSRFEGVKRRLEKIAEINAVSIYDDFAHHPTAIATTLNGMRAKHINSRLLAVLEPRSNTMRLGVHQHELVDSLAKADQVYCLQPQDVSWSLADTFAQQSQMHVYQNVEKIVEALVRDAQAGDQIIVMSNGGFDGIHGKLSDALKAKKSI